MPSAVIAAFNYDSATQTLTVRYHSGRVYNYLNVPEDTYKKMRATIAKGVWFNRHIKGKYPFKEVTPGLGQNTLFEPPQS